MRFFLRLARNLVAVLVVVVGAGVSVAFAHPAHDAIEIARAIEESGTVDAIVPSGGFTARTPFYLLRGVPNRTIFPIWKRQRK